MSDSLRVDSAAVRAASSCAESAAATATPGSVQVQPCATDVVSVAASTWFGSRMALARQYSTAANAVAAHYGVKLNVTATAYDRQEATAAAALGGGGLSGAAEGAIDAVSDLSNLPALSSMLGAAPLSGAGPGEVPSSPRDIARLIETGRGGAGKQAWQFAEASLQREAKQLDDAADQMGAVISAAGEGWQSLSADAAVRKMWELKTWYSGHADYVRGLAGEARTHIQNFVQATATIPSYKDVLAGERELQNAVEVNARSRGLHRTAVVHAQVKVSGLYSAATRGFTGYTAAESLPSPQMPTPPPGVEPDRSTDVGSFDPGDGKINAVKPPIATPSSVPVDPVQAGSGVGQDLSPGSTFPVGAVDPAVAADPFVDALPDTAGSLLSELVPGVIGGVVGGLGGAVGGLVGAGQKATQSMKQAAGPLMNELGQQHPESGNKPQESGDPSGSEPSSEPLSGGDLSTPDGVGVDGGGGEMEPAGGAEPMAAPPDMVLTPVAAAPVAAAPVAAAAPAPEAPAAGMGMGPMMAPPMGAGGAGGGAGPDVKDLYPERKLKMVAPPNSEPVKNRREGRDRKKDKDSLTTR